jgi:hypothetical protein
MPGTDETSDPAARVSQKAPDWVEMILGSNDPSDVWASIFSALGRLALELGKASAIDKATILPDRLLAESAWTLWDEFAVCAPSVIGGLKQFWGKSAPTGTAVLVLDGLSLRELPWIVKAAQQRHIVPAAIEVRGTETPTETARFAAALGLPGRAKLFNNQAPGSFVFSGEDTHTDVLDAPFPDCVGLIPSTPRIFVWHKWPDEPLIHLYDRQDDGPEVVAKQTMQQLTSDGFWDLVDRLRQGRRLVITGDHGYAVSKSFSGEITDAETVRLLRETFGARRCAVESPDKPWPRRHLPPLVCRRDGRLMVMGQRKWPVQGGFPHLCHGGLSLLEAAVPFIELPPM